MNNYDLKLNAANALYGMSGPSLVRVTLAIRDATLEVQIVYLEHADGQEVERYREFCTEVLAVTGSDVIDDVLIPVTSPSATQHIPPLEVKLYCVYGADVGH